MAEEQNVIAEAWNKRLNWYLENILRWEQLGVSNIDIYCDELRKKVGLDSVFSYKRNPNSNQQIILVEAKTSASIENLNRSKIQEWVDVFFEKVNCVPNSPEFTAKFNPEINAQFNIGLIALWVRDSQSYSFEEIQKWLSQLVFPKRRNPSYLCFVSNHQLSRFYSIHNEIERLKQSGAEYKSIKYFFPDIGTQSTANGESIPIETLLSKFLFCKAKKMQPIRGGTNSNEYDGNIVFYLGGLNEYHDLRFIGLALKSFQLLQVPEVEIYTNVDPVSMRTEIENFKKEFSDSNVEFHFSKISDSNDALATIPQNDK
jgi:hypothetical protein